MFGGHVRQGSAQVGASLAIIHSGSREIKVEQHRRGVRRDQDVGGFDVVVQDPAIVGVLECLGQPGAPPGNRLCEAAAAERLTPFRARPGLVGRPELVECPQ